MIRLIRRAHLSPPELRKVKRPSNHSLHPRIQVLHSKCIVACRCRCQAHKIPFLPALSLAARNRRLSRVQAIARVRAQLANRHVTQVLLQMLHVAISLDVPPQLHRLYCQGRPKRTVLWQRSPGSRRRPPLESYSVHGRLQRSLRASSAAAGRGWRELGRIQRHLREPERLPHGR